MLATRPDVLVLGGGGVLGEAWMTGVLAGIEDAAGVDLRTCDAFLGTSAGSIVATHLAAGRRPRRPAETDSAAPAGRFVADTRSARLALRRDRAAAAAARVAAGPVSRLVSVALAASTPGGALLRAGLLARVPRGRSELADLRARIDRLAVRFDGRLRVTGVDLRRGRRVVFGAPGAPDASVAEAVVASCAVPGLFAPVTIAGREYVDGGAWSPSNLDAAPVLRDTQVLCLNPIGGFSGSRPRAAAGRLARSAIAVEALALRRRGARVQIVVPDAGAVAAMGDDFMDAEPRTRVLAAGYAQGVALAGG